MSTPAIKMVSPRQTRKERIFKELETQAARIEALEKWRKEAADPLLGSWWQLLRRTFGGRLKWLLRGR